MGKLERPVAIQADPTLRVQVQTSLCKNLFTASRNMPTFLGSARESHLRELETSRAFISCFANVEHLGENISLVSFPTGLQMHGPFSASPSLQTTVWLDRRTDDFA
jgi:hypothetical protein